MTRNHLFAFLLLGSIAMPTMLGCEANVIGGGGQGGSGGGQPGGPGGGQPGGPGGSPPVSSGGYPVPGASGNARPAEGGYVVTLSNYASTCGATGVMPNCSTTAWWNVKLELGTADLVPGTTLPFSEVHGFSTEQLPGNVSQSDCGMGAGTFMGGSIEVVAASATELTLNVTDTSASSPIAGGIDGTYVVPICAGTALQNNGTAIALKYSQTPGNDGNSTASCTGGPYTDPDTLVLLVSNLGQSCADPFHTSQGCVDPRYQVSIQVPVDQQTTGTFPLGYSSSFSLSDGKLTPGACVGGGGGPLQTGTIDILAIDATSVKFTLAGTQAIGGGFGSADGTYTAPRCQ